MMLIELTLLMQRWLFQRAILLIFINDILFIILYLFLKAMKGNMNDEISRSADRSFCCQSSLKE